MERGERSSSGSFRGPGRDAAVARASKEDCGWCPRRGGRDWPLLAPCTSALRHRVSGRSSNIVFHALWAKARITPIEAWSRLEPHARWPAGVTGGSEPSRKTREERQAASLASRQNSAAYGNFFTSIWHSPQRPVVTVQREGLLGLSTVHLIGSRRGAHSQRPRVRRWSARTVDGERRAIFLGFLPGPRTRRRGSWCFDRRLRMVPSARWHRFAASRTVYQRSTSSGGWRIICLRSIECTRLAAPCLD
jgi:hypothetical protein